jgi:hypothetical protein
MRQTHETEPILINHQMVPIDKEIAPLIRSINTLPGILTVASCQGYDRTDGCSEWLQYFAFKETKDHAGQRLLLFVLEEFMRQRPKEAGLHSRISLENNELIYSLSWNRTLSSWIAETIQKYHLIHHER